MPVEFSIRPEHYTVMLDANHTARLSTDIVRQLAGF